MGNDFRSTTRLANSKLAPRSVSRTRSFPRRGPSRPRFHVPGAMNCPLLMFTVFPVRAAALEKVGLAAGRPAPGRYRRRAPRRPPPRASGRRSGPGMLRAFPTSARIARPAAIPGPRAECTDDRFALSHAEALKTSGRAPAPRSRQPLRRRESVLAAPMTQGPEIRKAGAPPPARTPARSRRELNYAVLGTTPVARAAGRALRRSRSSSPPDEALNSGCGRSGRDLNSGELAGQNQGWSFSSTISTNLRIGREPVKQPCSAI